MQETKFSSILLAILLAFGVAVGTVAVTNCGGCVGQTAREEVALPALQAATPDILIDIRRGIQELPPEEQALALEVTDRLVRGIEAGDATHFSDFALVRAWAEAGWQARVDAGELGASVVGSLRERMVQWEATARKYARPQR